MPRFGVSWESLANLAMNGYGADFNRENRFPVNLWLGRLGADGALALVLEPSVQIGLVILGLDPADSEDPVSDGVEPVAALQNLASYWVAASDGGPESARFWNGTRLLLQKLDCPPDMGILFMNLSPFPHDGNQNGGEGRRQATVQFLQTHMPGVPVVMLGREGAEVLDQQVNNFHAVYHPSSRGQFYKTLLNPPAIDFRN